MYDAPFDPAQAGELVDLGNGEVELRFERLLNHPLQKVWNAISIPERIGAWFCEMNFDARPGAKIDQTVHHANGLTATGVVLRFEPPHLFEWRSDGVGEERPSVVTWRLEPEGDKATRIYLTHRTPDRHLAHEFGHGWHVHLDGLEQALIGGRFIFPLPNDSEVSGYYRQAFA